LQSSLQTLYVLACNECLLSRIAFAVLVLWDVVHVIRKSLSICLQSSVCICPLMVRAGVIILE